MNVYSRKWIKLFIGLLLLGWVPYTSAADRGLALFLAIKDGAPARVEHLLETGVDPNARDERGEPALIFALHAQEFEAAGILIAAKGIDLDAENAYGQTALMVAAFQGKEALVAKLLDANAEVNHTGWTALHYAASRGRLEVVRTLVDHSAYIDAQSPNRTTPLMMAARAKSREVCQFLIDEGADPRPRNDAGLTAQDFAARAGDRELAQWLDRNVANWNERYPPKP